MYYKFTFGFKKEPCSNMMSVTLFLSIYVSSLCIFLSALVFWNWNDKSFAKNIYWNTHPFYILVLEFKIILSTYYFMKDFFFKILIFFFPTMFKIPWNYHDFTNFSFFWKSMKNDQKIIPSWLITILYNRFKFSITYYIFKGLILWFELHSQWAINGKIHWCGGKI